MLHPQAVDSENESKDAKPTSDSGLDLEDSLQDELCNLWDMSMNPVSVDYVIRSVLPRVYL